MSKYKSKYFISLIIGIVVLFIFSCSLTFVLKDKFYKKTEIDTTSVILNSDVSVLIIKNNLPTSDKFGKTITDDNAGSFIYLDFSVKNSSSHKQDFQMYLTKQTIIGKSINDEYVKVYLTDENDKPCEIFNRNALPSYSDLNYITDKADSKNIFKGTLLPNEEKYYRLRVWISDNYIIGNEDESFSFKIGARAI